MYIYIQYIVIYMYSPFVSLPKNGPKRSMTSLTSQKAFPHGPTRPSPRSVGMFRFQTSKHPASCY